MLSIRTSKSDTDINNGLRKASMFGRLIDKKWALALSFITLCFLIGDVKLSWEVCNRASNWNPNMGLKNASDVIGGRVKDLIQDEMAIFVQIPAAILLETMTGLGHLLTWVSANMLSTFHAFVGLMTGVLVSSPNLTCRRIAAALFSLRIVLDVSDGIVAEIRNNEAEERGEAKPMGFYTAGYYIDGVSDIVSTGAFLLGMCLYLWRKPVGIEPGERQVFLRQGESSLCCTFVCRCNQCWENVSNSRWQQVIIFVNFALQNCLWSVFWNLTVLQLSALLDFSSSVDELKGQLAVLASPLTALVFWLQRITTLVFFSMFFASYSVCVDKAWEYMWSLRFVGWVVVFGVEAVTFFYLQHARSIIHSSTATNSLT